MAKIFVTLKLLNGDTVTIDEVTGSTVFQAAFMAGPEVVKNGMLFSFYVGAICVKKDGVPVGLHYMQNLMIDDLSVIFESLNSQLVKVTGKR